MTMTAFMPIPASGMRKADRPLAERELLPTPSGRTPQLLKAIEDAFKSVVWSDDARVAEHRLSKRLLAAAAPRGRGPADQHRGIVMHTTNDPTK